jgi:hypothetical protein
MNKREQLIAELEALTGMHVKRNARTTDIQDAIDTWKKLSYSPQSQES